MPTKTVRCSKCGKKISGYNFEIRMEKLRKHYKKEHPIIWKRNIKKRKRR